MRLSVTHRIIGGFLLMAILSMIVGYFAFATTRNLQSVSRAIMNENIASLRAAEELQLALLNQKGFTASYILDGNLNWVETLEKKKQDFEIWFDRAKGVALTEDEIQILENIHQLYQTYDHQRNQAIHEYQAGNLEEAKRILLQEMRRSIDILYQKCEELIAANETLIGVAEAKSEKNVIRMKRLIWITIAFAIFLGASLGFLIARTINKQLILSAKMATLGRLSASIAHEIRNPLTSIKMRIFSLGEELKNFPAVKDDTSVIDEEINRIEKTVRNFLDFARPPELRLQKCNINEILKKTINLLSPHIKSQNIQIINQFNSPSLEVEMDKDQIHQVFLNILLNAVEAMPSGGQLTVKTNYKVQEKTIEIRIHDTGTGISHNVLSKVFEPFFTTKKEGTGLGLFIASRIIERHNGTIDLETHAGKGTTFIVKIPLQPRLGNSSRFSKCEIPQAKKKESYAANPHR